MARIHPIIGVLLYLAILPFSFALKFDLQAHTGHNNKYERCIRNFVAKDTLVLVTAIVSGQKGDGQMVNMHVRVQNIRFLPLSPVAKNDSHMCRRSKMRSATNMAGQRT